MANRTYNQFAGTLERKVVKLFAKILYAGGAPTLVTSEVLNSSTSPITINPSQGFESIVDDAPGVFTLVLGANNGGVPTYDPYVRLLNVAGIQVAGGTPTELLVLRVSNDNVNGASGNPSLQLETIVPAMGPLVPGDLDNGSVLLLEITLSNTTAY